MEEKARFALQNQAFRQSVIQSFKTQGMMATLGARLGEIHVGAVDIHAPIQPATGQQHGFGHAGLTFSLGDTAAGYAALTLLPADQDVVTAEMSVNLLAPARGVALIACGRVLRAGSRLITASADVWAEDAAGTRTHIAVMTGTMVPLARR